MLSNNNDVFFLGFFSGVMFSYSGMGSFITGMVCAIFLCNNSFDWKKLGQRIQKAVTTE